jgi:hypothetical protein
VATVQTTQQKYAGIVKTDLLTKLQAEKDQMLIDYIDEMVVLQADLQAEATKLQGCNWTCVDTCALTQTALASRVACLEQCGCYGTQPVQETIGGVTVPQVSASTVALHSHLSFLASPLTNTAVSTPTDVTLAFVAPTTTTSTVAATLPTVATVAVDPYVALQAKHDTQRLALDAKILLAEQKLAAD